MGGGYNTPAGNEVTLAAKGTVVGKAGLLRKRFPFDMEERLEWLRDLYGVNKLLD